MFAQRGVEHVLPGRAWPPNFGLPASTISQVLRRWAVPHLADLDRITGELLRSRVTEQSYEHSRPGDLLHVDVKELGRIPPGGGWTASAPSTTT